MALLGFLCFLCVLLLLQPVHGAAPSRFNPPTDEETERPTNEPTPHPTRAPTNAPTTAPTAAPTINPNLSPCNASLYKEYNDRLDDVCVSVCGDGIVSGHEQCDLGKANGFDPVTLMPSGCDFQCNVTRGFRCTVRNYLRSSLQLPSCSPICGDGIVTYPEACDSVVGCNSQCQPGKGYVCRNGVCGPKCGDGLVIHPEECDVNSVTCNSCSISGREPQYQRLPFEANCLVGLLQTRRCKCCAVFGLGILQLCAFEAYPPASAGAPSTCPGGIINPECGDKLIQGTEECDGNFGCNNMTCKALPGYTCELRDVYKNGCIPLCGDGNVTGDEQCDVQYPNRAQGCNTQCKAAVGWECFKNLTRCTTKKNDSLVTYPEECDAHIPNCENNTGRPKKGFSCFRGNCTPICGDGNVTGGEDCDNNLPGCLFCKTVPGYQCNTSTNICRVICGNGNVTFPEECDSVEGCTGDCQAKQGYACNRSTNRCAPICGDGLVITPEECDYDNNLSLVLQGCTTKCRTADGYKCDARTNVCFAICNDKKVVFPEECDSVFGCNATTCLPNDGYTCIDNNCTPLCGDGLVIAPEQCDAGSNLSRPLVGCNEFCQPNFGYACSNNTCAPICGDRFVIAPEDCDSSSVGCDENCRHLPGYVCSNNECRTQCGDGVVTLETEECDWAGANGEVGCSRFCKRQPGYECTPRLPCAPCKLLPVYVPYTKVPFPFPSLDNYSHLLNATSFASCTSCADGVQSFYEAVDDPTACKALPVVFATRACTYACNGFSFISPQESIAFLITQIEKDNFLNQVLGAIFGPAVLVSIDTSQKRDNSVRFTMQNCTNQTVRSNLSSNVFEIVAGIVRDIIPNASMLVNTVDGCSMETATNSNGLPIGLIVGVSIAILLVIIVVIVIAVLIRNYYKHDLHKLPIEITWSFLNKLSHPWLWEYRGNKNSHYYIRKYAQGSDEYRRVTNNLVSFAGLSSLPILDIFAVYNPALATSFLNQYNVFLERKRNDPGQFFANGGYARQPEKMWVIEQFRRYALQFAWNEGEDAVPIVPIVPALHGSDLAIAEKIAQTGFASLSTLDDGYFGKGIYFTTSLNYSLPYAVNKQIPVVILSYINMGHPYPVTEDHKGPKSLLGKGLRSGYNSHFVITTNDGYVYDQSKYSVFNTTETPCNEIVVGQESQILPAFIICLDKAKSQESWSSWHEVLTKAEHRASKSFQDQDLQILNEVKIDLSNKFADVLLEERACRQGDRGPSSPRSPRYRPPTSPTSPRVMRNVSSANFSGIPLDTNDSSPTDDLHYQLLDS